MASRESKTLPISGKPLPKRVSWQYEKHFLRRPNLSSVSRSVYRTALRLFADWTQTEVGLEYEDSDWPLSPVHLTTELILDFYRWLGANKATGTQNSYIASVVQYLIYLDTVDELPANIQLGKLQEELARSRKLRAPRNILTIDEVQDALEQIVLFYDRQSLPEQETAYKKRIILLRNRAIVHTLYSTGIGLSELISLNRKEVNEGKASNIRLSRDKSEVVKRRLSEEAKESLQAYLKERTDGNPALFVAHSRNAKGQRISATSIHNIVKRPIRELKLHESISVQHFRRIREGILASADDPLLAEKESADASRFFSRLKVEIQVSDLPDEFREIALYDLNQAERAFFNDAYKASIIMFGAVLEAIMLGTLHRDEVLKSMQKSSNPPPAIRSLGLMNPKLPTRIAEELNFEDYKNAIQHLIPHLERLKVDSIQSFRNAVHPWLSIKDPVVYADIERARTRAIHHLSSLEILGHHILTWSPG